MVVLEPKGQDAGYIVKKSLQKKDLFVEFMMQSPPIKLRYSCCVQSCSVLSQKPHELVVIFSIHDFGIRFDQSVS